VLYFENTVQVYYAQSTVVDGRKFGSVDVVFGGFFDNIN